MAATEHKQPVLYFGEAEELLQFTYTSRIFFGKQCEKASFSLSYRESGSPAAAGSSVPLQKHGWILFLNELDGRRKVLAAP